jgi:hypothetical protein
MALDRNFINKRGAMLSELYFLKENSKYFARED